MELTLCDEQEEELALRVKGDVTEAPLAGLLTLTELELLAAACGAKLAATCAVTLVAIWVAPALPTLIVTSSTQDAP